jgi:hypothetical protein
MAKEWANKDKYHPSDGVLEPHVQMPRAKASVRTVRAWGERKAVGGVLWGKPQLSHTNNEGKTKAQELKPKRRTKDSQKLFS